jgi:signal transduction histidine kinase/ligand-binding sensor domain-containing protein
VIATGTVLLALTWCSTAFALNPALGVNQYSHTAWKITDGFSRGVIRSIAQTVDGYLWLGTELGLLRFDGVRAVPWQPPADQSLPSDEIWVVLGSRDGALWIGTARGVARWKDGRLTLFPEVGDRIIVRLFEDHENTMWVAATSFPAGRLCAIRDRDVTCHGDDGRFGLGVWAIHEDRRGRLWLGVRDGIWQWRPGAPSFHPMSGERDAIQAFAEDGDGTLFVATRRGVQRLVEEQRGSYALSKTYLPFIPRRVLRDRDGALWIATRSGLVRVHEGKAETFAQADGLSSNDVQALFEDHEGNIWAATTNGLDRFRDVVVAAVSEKQGLPGPRVLGVRAAADGSMWLSTAERLAKWANGEFTFYGIRSRPPSGKTRELGVEGFPTAALGALLPDGRGRIWVSTSAAFGYIEHDRFVLTTRIPARAVRSLGQDSRGQLWIADQQAGLLRVSPGGDVHQILWADLGRKDFATAMVVDDARGGSWLGFWDGGVAYFESGRLHEEYSEDDGLSGGRVTSLRLRADGSLWVATEHGLSRVHAGKSITLTRTHGLPCDSVHWVIDDDVGSLWLDTACGLVRLSQEDVDGFLAGKKTTITPTVYDGYDGARAQARPEGYEPFVAKSPDGKLWFVGPNGLNIVDPRRRHFNELPPPVHVERIVADRAAIDIRVGTPRIDLPPLTRDLQIDYTALSLAAPEKVRFRYKLEGHDLDWQDVGTRRQAFYNDLRPGHYRFRVTASNNSGVWNETGTFVDLSVEPAYYQTNSFLALSVAAVVALIWGAHRLRLSVVEKHEREITALNERLMKAQEQERMRIAGELHDGIMQEMLAITMMLGTAKRRIPEGSDAKPTIDTIQDKMIRIGADIRRVSHDLHPPALQQAGLPSTLKAYCEEFSRGSGIPVSCEVDEDVHELSRGAALALFRITQEALGNAVKHAAAKRIRVRLSRSGGVVSLRVSDDGVGFDRAHLNEVRGLGLITMRERAGQLRGTFDFESARGRGTTISVTIPFR